MRRAHRVGKNLFAELGQDLEQADAFIGQATAEQAPQLVASDTRIDATLLQAAIDLQEQLDGLAGRLIQRLVGQIETHLDPAAQTPSERRSVREALVIEVLRDDGHDLGIPFLFLLR